MAESVIKAGRVAVITGAAKGIGAAAARRFAQEGMRLILFDRDGAALAARAKTLNTEYRLVTGDVTNEQDLMRLRDITFNEFGEVALLMNNAGIKQGGGPWDAPADWRIQIESNLLAMVTVQHLFVPAMLGMNKKGAIVNLGSKEGITTPPGNAAYSVAKAGLKVLTEQLAHELRNIAGERITAHLLVPGFTWTDMNFPGMQPDKDSKPDEAWTPDQVIEHFLERYEQGDFYIICPDNTVSPEMDKKRIAWAFQDILENRPALSRWHPQWKDAFSQWMNK
ncbi:SDR family oxidoreductase [Pantoea sp. Bo_2]|uniref:SDR family NAD(P)-dependent oxidoreductase n=1 Tax=unclassified Pantoea TaxID=2630326 RepID=UPI00123289EA|nr:MULTISPECIES: SDR family oxidoreductase [unclassified Pantoea]KAA5942251.1 SDR family oxidoreductase [Pantoea sp. VH_3]KAA5950171.1 SDR family oxidoreductase [Pantoea sp. VH_25]KAA5955872.1 SDR family oxidoreductase [Pantoea sp. VH_16]KAA5957919.1 SDR family oxidoreductase [Pantoea sp. VH_24]KAA5962912.1 SDR family oxidoreductase [Pantoea sp. VH_18]